MTKGVLAVAIKTYDSLIDRGHFTNYFFVTNWNYRAVTLTIIVIKDEVFLF